MSTPPESFFQRLTRLFRSGPAIQRRVKGYDSKNNYSAHLMQGNYGYRASAPFGFGRENSPFSVLGQYGMLDRMARYAEFSEMEYTPEIAQALKIFADEVVGGDDRGKCFHIYSNNIEIKRALDDLFYDILNVEFNLNTWSKNLVKYGDFFLLNEVLPDIGVINATPIPVSELEREEGYDINDPFSVRFKWVSRGNKYLENWQITHFRVLGNDLFLPYGTSMLESSRRIWRQLIMLEDAMLTYRIVRSPERRVFYIDVSNIAPNDVPSYMDAVKATLKTNGNVDRENGREDGRYNAQSMLDDYYIPIRGDKQGTKIDTLQSGQHVSATEDVEYIQRKLFAALGVPKPYMNFDENLSAKASLAQMDVRFSRTIQSLQKILIAELNKLAMIHLYAKGFDGADLIDFELKLSNPSSIALQQKLELWAVKFDIAGTAKETKLVDENWIHTNILELTKEETTNIVTGLRIDKLREIELETIQPKLPSEEEQPKVTDPFDPSNYDVPGADVSRTPAPDEDLGTGKDVVLNKFRSYDEDGNSYVVDLEQGKAPIKATPFLTRHKKNRKRRLGVGRGRDNTAMPDLAAMLSPKNKYNKDVNGQKTESVNYDFKKFLDENAELKDVIKGRVLDDYSIQLEPLLTTEMKGMFGKLRKHMNDVNTKKRSGKLITEDLHFDDEISIETTDDGDIVLENIDLIDSVISEKHNEESGSEDLISDISNKGFAEVFKEDEES